MLFESPNRLLDRYSVARYGEDNFLSSFVFYLSPIALASLPKKTAQPQYKFTIPIPPFNATFRTQKNLLVNIRFSECLKIASFRCFCEESSLSSETTRRL